MSGLYTRLASLHSSNRFPLLSLLNPSPSLNDANKGLESRASWILQLLVELLHALLIVERAGPVESDRSQGDHRLSFHLVILSVVAA